MIHWRASGILLHLTSLPNDYGIGDLGQSAYDFIDFLVASQQSYWQILPLGPTDQYHSPYAPYSAFAGNPFLISLEELVKDNLLLPTDLKTAPQTLVDSKINYSQVLPWKEKILRLVYHNFSQNQIPDLIQAYTMFCKTNSFWLNDYAIFISLKKYFNNTPWTTWPTPIVRREVAALNHWERVLAEEIEYHKFTQYLFFKQWQQLKLYAQKNQIKIIGDLPIFVAHDSADVWVFPHLFKLNADGNPTVVAGVPPDYFSQTGQLWGNPHYCWYEHENQQFHWWITRLEMLLKLVDIIRIDHFRGFAAAWEVPYWETTAINGTWQKGPGAKFFRVVKEHFGEVPFIAEDLGFITPDVVQLRKQWDLPGMKVLQFAFASLEPNIHLPHHHDYNSVVYTGTHDNDTTLGWYQKTTAQIRTYTRNYLNSDGKDLVWDLIRAAFASPAKLAIIPLQDLLRLDHQARMNTPGLTGDNWSWRYHPEKLSNQLILELCELTNLYQRNLLKQKGDLD